MLSLIENYADIVLSLDEAAMKGGRNVRFLPDAVSVQKGCGVVEVTRFEGTSEDRCWQLSAQMKICSDDCRSSFHDYCHTDSCQ
jgi:hypothetical protein